MRLVLPQPAAALVLSSLCSCVCVPVDLVVGFRDGGEVGDAGDADAGGVDAGGVDAGSFFFAESFEIPGADAGWWEFGFDVGVFGIRDQPWSKSFVADGGVNGSGCLQVTSTFDSLDPQQEVNGFLAKALPGLTHLWSRQCWNFAPSFPGRSLDVSATLTVWRSSGHGTLQWSGGGLQPLERVRGVSSGAEGHLFEVGVGRARLVNRSGAFLAGEDVVGLASGGRVTGASFVADDNVITQAASMSARAGGLESLAIASTPGRGASVWAEDPANLAAHSTPFSYRAHLGTWWCLEAEYDVSRRPWLSRLWLTTQWGARNLPSGTSGMDGSGVTQYHDFLYLETTLADVPALEPGKGYDVAQVGAAFHGVASGASFRLDAYAISTAGKIGHPFR